MVALDGPRFAYVTDHRAEYNPLKVLGNRLEAYKQMTKDFIGIFGSAGKA